MMVTSKLHHLHMQVNQINLLKTFKLLDLCHNYVLFHNYVSIQFQCEVNGVTKLPGVPFPC